MSSVLKKADKLNLSLSLDSKVFAILVHWDCIDEFAEELYKITLFSSSSRPLLCSISALSKT